jgi:glutamine synthetase
VAVPGVGNGGHVHLSVWRGETNLMGSGDGPAGLAPEAEAFCAGMLAHLPGLMAVGAPSPVSYLRQVPSHWAGVYECWGVENREAAMRVVTGSSGSESWAANVEVKCFDLLANPYLVLAGLLAAGSAGLDDEARLPPPVDVDPAVLDETTLAERDVRRLPTNLADAAEAFESDAALTAAFGADLVASLLAIRRSDLEQYADLTDEELAAATRWLH